MNAAVQQRESQFNRWVTFRLADEIYGINVMQVQEVLRMTEIAPVPGAPGCVLGIINLRGNVVTVVDAHHIARHIEDTHEAEEQIAFADVILLNKCDLVPAEKLDGLEKIVREVNALATIHRTTRAEIDIAKILEVGGFNLDRATELNPHFLEPDAHHHHHHSEFVVSSCSCRCTRWAS